MLARSASLLGCDMRITTMIEVLVYGIYFARNDIKHPVANPISDMQYHQIMEDAKTCDIDSILI